jgi:beta-lactamase superfamily II metal-dependent hydrolase
MKDICNANALPKEYTLSASVHSELAEAIEKSMVKGNFRMCQKPTQPLDYLKEVGVNNIFRFTLSHPDMDHMDGLDKLFDEVTVSNYWDSGVRREKPLFDAGSLYEEEDWDRYEDIITDKEHSLTVLMKREGARFESANKPNGGDGLYVLSPNKTLVDSVEEETNDASYVVLYRSIGGKILLPGDAHDGTWEHICNNYEDDIRNCSILIAPHHGRDSGMDFSFLKTVNPQLVLMGCAKSKDLAYGKYRNYNRISNNQAGNVIVDIDSNGMDVFVENEKYAEKYGNTFRRNSLGYCFVMRINKNE